MSNQILKYEFDKDLIEFEIINGNVMVNATQMAKVFGKEPEPFTRNESTKDFISECLKTENSRFISIEKEEDIIISRQKSGTFMHRILALKFAAWLNPRFELWVYSTIDEILYGYYKRLEEDLKVSAKRVERIEELENSLCNNDEFNELEALRSSERKASRRRANENKNQMDVFKQNSGAKL